MRSTTYMRTWRAEMRTYNYLSNERPRELIELYSDIEQELLRIIVKELKKGTPPTEVFAKMQEKMQSFDDKSQKVLAIIMKDVEYKAIKDGERDFKQEETDSEPVSKGLANALVAPAVIGGMAILAQLNKQVVNNAINEYTEDYLQVQAKEQRKQFGGGLDVLESIYRKLANKGITIRESIRGKTRDYSIENIIRRDVMYKVNQVNAKVNMENFKQSSAKFIEVSSHPTARTWTKYMKHPYEDHSSWQGKVYYSREGEPVAGYEEFESTCGYGEMLGIGGINCYHQFKMNYTGDSSATQYSEQEVEKQYALSQQQRMYERGIRKLKSARAVFEEAGDDVIAKSIGRDIRLATSGLRDFCEKYDLKYYNWRTQI